MRRKYEITFKWQAGDILILNNIHWSHSRTPYKGQRNIVSMMGYPLTRKINSYENFDYTMDCVDQLKPFLRKQQIIDII